MDRHYQNRILQIFPKLYYFVPPVLLQKIASRGKAIRLRPPMDALLWLLETLQSENDEPDCLQRDLQELMRWSFPQTNFSRTLSYLISAGCVTQTRDPADRRLSRVMLTSKGKEVLEKIKSDRAAYIGVVLDKLTESDREIVLTTLERLADITWKGLSEFTGRNTPSRAQDSS